MSVPEIEDSGYLSSRWLVLSISVFQGGRGVELEMDGDVKELISREANTLLGPGESGLARRRWDGGTRRRL